MGVRKQRVNSWGSVSMAFSILGDKMNAEVCVDGLLAVETVLQDETYASRDGGKDCSCKDWLGGTGRDMLERGMGSRRLTLAQICLYKVLVLLRGMNEPANCLFGKRRSQSLPGPSRFGQSFLTQYSAALFRSQLRDPWSRGSWGFQKGG